VEAKSNTEDEARAEFKRAASLTLNARERELLLVRVTSKALEPGTWNPPSGTKEPGTRC
jgi:hypothetical protein